MRHAVRADTNAVSAGTSPELLDGCTRVMTEVGLWQRESPSSQFNIYVVRDGDGGSGAVVGCLWATVDKAANYVKLDLLAVLQSHQRRGNGSLLLKRLEKDVREANKTAVRPYNGIVLVAMPDSVDFYLRHKYRMVDDLCGRMVKNFD